jgi:hypothetical protein
MRLGFDFSGICDREKLFEEVIATGEPLLARTNDPGIEAEIRVMLGDAYATIVALAHGAAEDYASPAAYAAREPDARRKALAHYRAALELDDKSSARAARVWSVAWRLAAGLPPVSARYFCIYD